MNLPEQTIRSKAYHPSRLILVFVMLFTACFAGSAAASSSSAPSASSELIIVNKKTNTLAYFSGGKLEKEFPVATGKTKSLTPEGSFKIVVKIKNRPYYKEKIPGGDPANPLGDRWLGLEVNNTYGTTYAIHGNNNEASIGKYVSAGCIRMHNDDIHWLYPRIAKNTTVIITSSNQTMASLASASGYRLGQKQFAGTFMIDGAAVKLNEPLIMENGRVYLPLRESVALLGGTLQQEAGSGALIITIGSYTAIHKPLADLAVVNGKNVKMIASLKQDGRLYLPLGSLPALFGLQLKWEPQEQTVFFQN
ncbi:L,D-transpeptidase family protein [Paenibacillus sp. MMS20-IR301]|uniref:L,D-transpeptidase family protein n=1 Tax=Paenibacillus sp. MMS20-IR301 TaxID=2895946 RepID=UPI0028F14F23|nr:L,D-transpeptidase family protein [Paenibacillus sp. MMS20-IR301]WNS41133.1 L,D-transpeptidase family protein [Paenibacillus sp. MMS20-IR301]